MVAYIIDLLIMAVLQGAIGMFGQFLVDILSLGEPYSQWITIVFAIIGVLSYLAYYIGFWVLAGQTPGKSVMGLRIVRTNGDRIGFWRALIRLLGYLITPILLLGCLLIPIDRRRQALHDKIAGTLVVYAGPADLQPPPP
jgi:uncharacterized RDD family membrane protein YckC